MMAGWIIAVIIALGALLNAGEDANAQIQSRSLIRVVVPFTAGSPNDIVARLVGDQLSSRLQQAVIIENRPGAGTTIGSKAVATAVPDGNTLLFISSSLVIDPPLYKTTDYDPIKSFAPIATVASTPWVMVVPSTLPARSIPELVAYATSNPGKMNFGYALGTASQMLGELFKIATATEITSVPYKGGTGVVPDMLGGRVQLYFGTAAMILPLIRDGKLRALAITSDKRSPLLPEVPTMTESGLPELSSNLWMGMLAPAGTPAELVNKLNDEINKSLKSPKLVSAMTELGFEAQIGSPQDFAAFIAEEAPKWAAIVKASGARVD